MPEKTPTSGSEVEDVLSSIRRLVSDEARARIDAEKQAEAQALAAQEAEAEAAAKAEAEAAAEDGGEAETADADQEDAKPAPLVLTSSQRVADTVSASAREAVEEPQAEESNGPDNSAALPSFLAVGPQEESSIIDEIPEEEEVQAEDFVVDTSPLYDEKQLRELVGDVVREELRGELGDKITRNIRKMIRRELSLMLNQAKK